MPHQYSKATEMIVLMVTKLGTKSIL